jgi:FkbH-like protein
MRYVSFSKEISINRTQRPLTIESMNIQSATSNLYMNRLSWQKTCLSYKPSRLELLDLTCDWPKKTLKVRVHRNHAFEFMRQPIEKFLAFSGLDPIWELMDYDDSLSLNGVIKKDDINLEILWIDFDRYTFDEKFLKTWLEERLTALRERTKAPIIISSPSAKNNSLYESVANTVNKVAGIYLLDIRDLELRLGEKFIDLTRSSFQGTAFSQEAQLLLSQRLGLAFIPAIIMPRIKAIAIDLDNTLYKGVLGEDGPAGLVLTDGHKKLQERLVKLGQEGILLSVTSKNEITDVERMFAVRNDFPIRMEHLAGVSANWDSKAQNIENLAKQFNIDHSSFLMLDDNPGELFSTSEKLPGIFILHANENAMITCQHLANFPGLLSFTVGETDTLRSSDIKALSQRRSISVSRDPLEYLVALDTEICFTVQPHKNIARMCELPQKTNQFNLALRRIKESEVFDYLNNKNSCIVSFNLKDRLSNSGNVGAIYARAIKDILIIEELCVSCRALGRSLEDIMIGSALELAALELGGCFSGIQFTYSFGPRNQPALRWLAKLSGVEIASLDGKQGISEIHSLNLPISILEKMLVLRQSLPEGFITVNREIS